MEQDPGAELRRRRGEGCPPPARGSALLTSIEPGTVSLAVGDPVVAWEQPERE